MSTADQILQRKNEAAEEFNRHTTTELGEQFVHSISSGLCNLKNLGVCRLFHDTQELFEADSMMIPTSPIEIEDRIALELELYFIAETVCYMRDETGYDCDDWFLPWLGKLRIGSAFNSEAQSLTERYLQKPAESRRLKFVGRLDRFHPAASRIPLVLFRLLPLAVHGVVTIALGDMWSASEIRNEQVKLLPDIVECTECHGRPLDNGDLCECCHNPIWKYNYLTSTD